LNSKPSKKTRVDESTEVVEIKQRTPGLRILSGGNTTTGNHNEMLQKDNEDGALIMPLSLDSQKNTKQRSVTMYEGRRDNSSKNNSINYNGSNNDDDDSESIAEIGRNTFTEVSARTDLWNSVIESTWKGQGDAESECEDSSSSSSSSED